MYFFLVMRTLFLVMTLCAWFPHPLKRTNEIAQVGWKWPSILPTSQHLGNLKDFSLYHIDNTSGI